MMNVIDHYDLLIDEDNDPFRDPPMLQEYMSQWDGERFIEALELTKNKKVLEIGIGTGRIAVKVAPFCMTLTGIDISPKTIERAKENLKEYKNISFICDDFRDYQFTRTFDVIYSSLTMMHFKNKATVITKVYKLLNDDGSLIINEGDKTALSCYLARFTQEEIDELIEELLNENNSDFICTCLPLNERLINKFENTGLERKYWFERNMIWGECSFKDKVIEKLVSF